MKLKSLFNPGGTFDLLSSDIIIREKFPIGFVGFLLGHMKYSSCMGKTAWYNYLPVYFVPNTSSHCVENPT